jgi:hypothetical protein
MPKWKQEKIKLLEELKVQETSEDKVCNLCFIIKPLGEFYSHRQCRKGVSSGCKKCVRKDRESPDKKRHHRSWCLNRQFGISIQEYEAMLLAQNNCCAICKVSANKFTRQLAVDHCHETGSIRGLLCGNCNTAIGKFKDRIENLQSAAEYLRKHHGNNHTSSAAID